MSLIEHAKSELTAIGMGDNATEINALMRDSILDLVETFAKQGHSGTSAQYCIQTLTKLLAFEPLTRLTGEDAEWIEVADDLWQNNRCFSVFKTQTGAYNIDGKIFVEPDGAAYTNIDSRVPITFPYSPESEYVNVPAREEQ